MTEETYTFEQAKARLEEIAKQAKGASLDKSLDLLEEGGKLANVCTERIDHTRWRDEVGAEGGASDGDADSTEEGDAPGDQGAAETPGDAPAGDEGDGAPEPEAGAEQDE